MIIGAIISDVFSDESAKDIEGAFEVPVKRMRIGMYHSGWRYDFGYKFWSDHTSYCIRSRTEFNRRGIGIDPEPATVNGGVPFVSLGVSREYQGAACRDSDQRL